MKYAFPVIAVALLSACAPDTPVAPSEMPVALKAFNDVCLKTAPTFANAATAAAAYGITDITDAGFSKLGFNQDHSLGVQIKESKECVITTPEQKNPALTKLFLQQISRASGASLPKSVPVKATINGELFFFLHDRKGGETFVMLNPVK